MRPLLVALILLAASLAGCAGLDLNSLRPTGLEARTVPWGLTDCSFAVALLPAHPDKVAEFLPKGFRPLTFTELGLPPDPRGGGNVGLELWQCADTVGLNGTTGAASYAAIFAAVKAPPGFEVNTSKFHFYKWDVLVADAELRQVLQEAGAAAYEGNGSWSQFRSLPQGVFSGSFQMNGTYGLQGTFAAPGDEAMKRFNFTEFMAADHGYVWWNITVEAPTLASGTGRVTLPGGILQTIVGSTSSQAYFLGGQGSFPNATITLPPRQITH